MKLNWYEQEQAASCVAACVRMVLSGYGALYSEAGIRQWLGNPRLGITLRAARTRLAQTGAVVGNGTKIGVRTICAMHCGKACIPSSASNGNSLARRQRVTPLSC